MKETMKLVLLVSALSLVGGACTQESTAAASAGLAEPAKSKPAPAGKPQKTTDGSSRSRRSARPATTVSWTRDF